MAKSTTKVTLNLGALYDRENKAMRHAIWRQGQRVLEVAQDEKLVPLDTGTLRRSGVVTLGEAPNMGQVYDMAKSRSGNGAVVVDGPDKKQGRVVEGYVSYNTPYAARLHEDCSWEPRDHRTSMSGETTPKPAEGECKYLEKAATRAQQDFEQIAAETFQRYF